MTLNQLINLLLLVLLHLRSSSGVIHADIIPGSESSLPHNFVSLKRQNRVLFLVENPGNDQVQPWVVSRNISDGSIKTSLLKGVTGNVVNLYPFQDEAVFVTVSSSAPYLYQLWSTQGTQETTFLVHTFQTNLQRSPSFTPYQDQLYYRQGSQLWKLNEQYNTVLVHDLVEADEFINALYVWQDILYFSLSGNKGLFRTDGNEIQLLEPNISVKFRDLQPEINGKMFFLTVDRQLWYTDGTKHNTASVSLQAHDNNEEEVVDLFRYSVQGKIVFGIGDGQQPRLYSTDGTPEGTRLLQLSMENAFYFVPTTDGKNSSNSAAALGGAEYRLFVTDFMPYGDQYFFPGRVASTRAVSLQQGRLLAFTVSGVDRTGLSIWTTDGVSVSLLFEFVDSTLHGTLQLDDGRFLIRVKNPDEIWLCDGTRGGSIPIYFGDDHPLELEGREMEGDDWDMLDDTTLVFSGFAGNETGVELLSVQIPKLVAPTSIVGSRASSSDPLRWQSFVWLPCLLSVLFL